MHKAYKIRIYPNETQKVLFAKTFGCCRFVYNYMLDLKQTTYTKDKLTLSVYDCIKQLPDLKKEHLWLKEVDSVALQQSIKDLGKAYQNFFRDPRVTGFPHFKSKYNHRQTYRTNANGNNIRIVDLKHIHLPKLGSIKAKISDKPQGRILSATIEHSPSNKYFCTVLCDTDIASRPKPKNDAIGVDLGVTKLVATSNGTTYENPHALAIQEEKLLRAQKILSRKKKGSKNYEKQRIRVARLHEKVKNTRKDAMHKLTTALINENQVIVAETLKPKNMVKNHHLARSISDASFGEIIRQFSYKAEWYKRTFIQIDQFFPSTKTCSRCGYTQDIPLSQRTYVCPQCGLTLDRDINAAKNILQTGLKQLGWDTPEVNACGEHVRPTQIADKAELSEARIPCL